MTAYWDWTLDLGIIPPLIWVPSVIILFPLIMPGPRAGCSAPRSRPALMSRSRSCCSTGAARCPRARDDYIRSFVNSAFGVAFAYMGARVVYRLGGEVAAARELGSYRLEERLGQGGMGEVWRARHRMLARPAAIKLIRPAARRAGARPSELRAPVRAGGAGHRPAPLAPHGRAVRLRRRRRRHLLLRHGAARRARPRRAGRGFGPLPAERAIHLLRQVCHSLAEAHARGLVHRDIKPANIFLCRYGEDHDFVKVLDFGLVKALDGRTGGRRRRSRRENVVQGTPAFMAPEQAMGDTGMDGRADIYATGCVAYWLLTGQLVFTAETPMGIIMHQRAPRPPRPRRVPTSPIPPPLERLILACLEKAPLGRPQPRGTYRSAWRKMEETRTDGDRRARVVGHSPTRPHRRASRSP